MIRKCDKNNFFLVSGMKPINPFCVFFTYIGQKISKCCLKPSSFINEKSNLSRTAVHYSRESFSSPINGERHFHKPKHDVTIKTVRKRIRNNLSSLIKNLTLCNTNRICKSLKNPKRGLIWNSVLLTLLIRLWGTFYT
jgi:hypothetical protein